MHTAHILFLTALTAATGASASVTEQQVRSLVAGKPQAEARAALAALDQADPFVLYYTACANSDADSAVALFNTVVQKHPRHDIAGNALFELAQYNYAMGYYMTAARQYEDLTDTYPESPRCGDALFWGAAAYLAVRQPEKARTMYERYLGRFSDLNEEVQLGIGDSYFVEKEFEKALRAYKLLINTYPNGELVTTAQAKIAECYGILGRDDKAAEFEQKVKDVAPGSFPAVQVTQDDGRKTQAPVKKSGYVPPPAPEERATGSYVIQVGSFSQPDNARSMTERLQAKEYPAAVAVNIINAKQYYRVWVGPYATKDQAKKTAAMLKEKENLDYIIKAK